MKREQDLGGSERVWLGKRARERESERVWDREIVRKSESEKEGKKVESNKYGKKTP